MSRYFDSPSKPQCDRSRVKSQDEFLVLFLVFSVGQLVWYQ